MKKTLHIAAEALARNAEMARVIGVTRLNIMLDRCRDAGEHTAAQNCRRALRELGAVA